MVLAHEVFSFSVPSGNYYCFLYIFSSTLTKDSLPFSLLDSYLSAGSNLASSIDLEYDQLIPLDDSQLYLKYRLLQVYYQGYISNPRNYVY